MVGIPWSGKSFTADILKEKYWYTIVSKDTIRLSNPWVNERAVSELQYEFIKTNAIIWQDIIVDNTHCFAPSLNKIKSQLIQLWYDVSVYDMEEDYWSSSEYLNCSIYNNSLREWYKRVPESVIHQMYLQTHTLERKCIIVDVDWTLAKMSDRIDCLSQTPKNHDEFYARVSEDTPHQPVVHVVNMLAETHDVVIVSWRRNQSCADTIAWLDKYGVKYNHILMRNANDRRPDRMVKKEIYERCLKHQQVTMVFDDRGQVIEYRRSIWLYVFNCCQEESNDF